MRCVHCSRSFFAIVIAVLFAFFPTITTHAKEVCTTGEVLQTYCSVTTNCKPRHVEADPLFQGLERVAIAVIEEYANAKHVRWKEALNRNVISKEIEHAVVASNLKRCVDGNVFDENNLRTADSLFDADIDPNTLVIYGKLMIFDEGVYATAPQATLFLTMYRPSSQFLLSESDRSHLKALSKSAVVLLPLSLEKPDLLKIIRQVLTKKIALH